MIKNSTVELLTKQSTIEVKRPRRKPESKPVTVYALQFRKDNDGPLYRTKWTTYEGEARSWGKIIQDNGWCTSAEPSQVPLGVIEEINRGVQFETLGR